MQYSLPLSVKPTPVPGLLVLQLPVHGDARGWFKENWQRARMTALGLPDFHPVQNNVSFNEQVGTTRGIHAEPWDKLVSVATGRVFGAWVDLREGPGFGTAFTTEIDPSTAVFVPRGVGNAFQTLEPATAYSYLVNEHWSAEAQSEYTFLNLADETVAIEWPIPLERATMSEKDRAHPRLSDVRPMPARRPLVVGADGQVGRALRTALPHAAFLTRAELDLADPAAFDRVPWREHDVVVNAAAYTRVDEAETEEGRRAAWAVNVHGTARLVRAARVHDLALVHVSSDYVFDGRASEHPETEPFSPLGVYGQTKAAADAIVAGLERHYIVRSSWVVGEGQNFVRTMASLAERGVRPTVVDDQVGRLTFAADLAAGIAHLLRSRAPYGTYNLTNEGPPVSWAQIAARVFELTGHDPAAVSGVSTEEYFAGRSVAPRPLRSVLPLDRIRATGFRPRDADAALREYLAGA